MAQISVRNLEEDAVERLRIKARLHGRSLEAEVRDILERSSRLSREEFIAFADAMKAEIRDHNGGRLLPDSTPLVREDRDR
jgi:plasmid stability protein